MTDDFGTEGQVGRHSTAVVNGPEGDDLDWQSIDWQQVEDDVQRLRQRIFTASRAGVVATKQQRQHDGGRWLQSTGIAVGKGSACGLLFGRGCLGGATRGPKAGAPRFRGYQRFGRHLNRFIFRF